MRHCVQGRGAPPRDGSGEPHRIDGRRLDLQDGLVVDGASEVDRAWLTGESRPELVELGAVVHAGIVMSKNGEPFSYGAGAAVMGHPAAAVAMIANLMARHGERLPAGSLVLTGGITEAVSVKAGDVVQLRAQSLGSVSVRFV